MITRLGFSRLLRSPFQRRRRSRENSFRRETSLQSDSESEQKRTFTRMCGLSTPRGSLRCFIRGANSGVVVRIYVCVCYLKIIYFSKRAEYSWLYKISLIIHLSQIYYICKRFIINDCRAFISVVPLLIGQLKRTIILILHRWKSYISFASS